MKADLILSACQRFGIDDDPGIYAIINFHRRRQYIGSAIRLRKRINEHRNKLRRNIHENAKLQECWNKYGEAEFDFMVLEHVDDKHLLLAREQEWINKTLTAPHQILNISLRASSTLGVIPSAQTRAKMSLAGRGRKLPPRSPEHCAAIAAAKRGKKMPPQSAVSRERKSIAMRGNSNPLGCIRSEETKKRMSDAQKKRFAL